MKRSLLATAATALLLSGCATGDTGHLDPEISPELNQLRSTQTVDEQTGGDEEPGTSETPAPGTSAGPANEVEAAFSEESGGEAWFTDVTSVDVDDDSVLVITRLEQGDEDAVAVCEAVRAAAESTGIASPSVDVRAVDGTTIAQRDAEAGDQGCAIED